MFCQHGLTDGERDHFVRIHFPIVRLIAVKPLARRAGCPLSRICCIVAILLPVPSRVFWPDASADKYPVSLIAAGTFAIPLHSRADQKQHAQNGQEYPMFPIVQCFTFEIMILGSYGRHLRTTDFSGRPSPVR